MRSRLRAYLGALVILAVAAPAVADPRLVRVIWDVGEGAIYSKVEIRTKTGYDAVVLPASNAPDALKEAGFVAVEETNAILKKGDRVRLYIVNYNSVAHVWHDSSTIEAVQSDPSLVGALLSAALTGLGGGKAFPAAGLVFSAAAGAVAVAVAPACQQLNSKLSTLLDGAEAVEAAGSKVLLHTRTAELKATGEELAEVPTKPTFWMTYANTTAWNLILEDPKVFGRDFAADFKDLGDTVAKYEEAVKKSYAAILDFDGTLMKTANPAVCKPLSDQRDNLQGFIKGVTSSDSPVSQVAASYRAAATLWKDYRRKLSGWNDVQEMSLKDPVPAEAVVRVDAVFASPNPKFSARARKSAALKVRTFFPVLTISSGVGANRFDFKKLQVIQTIGTADSATVAKNKIEIVDDTTWDPITPVWTQNVRIGAAPDAGLYATFGTTPDRNIFKNAIVGASVVVPRWRTAFTVGMIAAKGHEEKDLEDVAAQFTDPSTGLMIKDSDVSKLPVIAPRWKASPYVSITFMLVSF